MPRCVEGERERERGYFKVGTILMDVICEGGRFQRGIWKSHLRLETGKKETEEKNRGIVGNTIPEEIVEINVLE